MVYFKNSPLQEQANTNSNSTQSFAIDVHLCGTFLIINNQ